MNAGVAFGKEDHGRHPIRLEHMPDRLQHRGPEAATAPSSAAVNPSISRRAVGEQPE